MLRSGWTKVVKEEFYGAKNPINIRGANVNNIVISNIFETKKNSKYFIGYSSEVITPLVLLLPKMNGYVKIFKVKDGDKDKSNKLMSIRIDDEKLLEKYKTICTKIKDFTESFTKILIDSLLVYENKYYLQVYLDNCVYKIVNLQTLNYLGGSLFKNYK